METGQVSFSWFAVISALIYFVISTATVEAQRSFKIDYENDQFLKDGEPFRYVSGSFHYFRAPRAYWQDHLRKMRAAGLNAVSTYVEWNRHEPTPGEFVFTGELDLPYFIQLAQEEDLHVLLRPGPYICAEREMGGLPSWLLQLKPDIQLRTTDPTFMEYSERYLNELLTRLKPYLYGNGGPIILVQVENEYGFFSCDKDYTAGLRDIIKASVGDAAVLYTTDGPGTGSLDCGKIPDVYATVDFGVGNNAAEKFSYQRQFEPHGPFVNSEFYSGWITHWGENLARVDTNSLVESLKDILSLNASVNFYMFYGGSNFGFTSGANYGNEYQPQITSYDYDAPLTEAGDPTDKYYALRDAIGEFLPLPEIPLPTPAPKGDYGSVAVEPVSPLIETTPEAPSVKNQYPLTFEALGQRNGFVLYETTVSTSATDASLSIPGISDAAYVLVDGVLQGILSRAVKITSLQLSIQQNQKLQVLVENRGRINFGSMINDFKGFVSNATLDDNILTDWIMTGYPLNDISVLDDLPGIGNAFTFNSPTFFRGVFKLPSDANEALDTYLDTTGWGKGLAFINGFNLGRYWPITGPEVTLYVPGIYLKPYPEDNVLILLEQELVNPSNTVSLISDAILDRLPSK